jgi:hypothetical protein
MKELLFSNEVMLEDEKVMKLDYSLTEEISKINQSHYYGVKITKYLDDLIESDETSVSESWEDTVEIIKKLYLFTVTPVSMVEIVDELVTQGGL